MPNYDVHVLSGIVSYPVIVAAAGLATAHGAPLALTTMALVLGYAFYVLGSDLPDMDHPEALIHRGTKPIVSVAVGSAVFIWAHGHTQPFQEAWMNSTFAWLLGAVGGLGAWYGFKAIMPKHRGIVHSLLFAAVYGGLAFVLVEYGLNMTRGEGLYVGFAAFSGYVLHLLLDRELSLL